MRPLFLFLLGAATLAAQPVSFGAKIGLPLNDFIDTVSSGNSSLRSLTTTHRYIVGPDLELRLPWGFAIEVDALYRKFDFQSPTSVVSTNDWEFPLLLKYRFASHHFVRPYIGGGVAFDRLQGLTATVASAATSIVTSNPPELKNTGTVGAVLGGGLDVHFLFIHITPEIRYTRWTSQHFTLANVLNSSQNQAEFLVGITF
jgi:hypothetical protein